MLEEGGCGELLIGVDSGIIAGSYVRDLMMDVWDAMGKESSRAVYEAF